MKFRNICGVILAGVLAATLPTLGNAQDTREPARTDTRDNGPDLGWLGLLGLVGLFGLKRRDREHDSVSDRGCMSAQTR